MLTLSPKPNSVSATWQPDANGNYPSALGARLSSTSYMMYGTFKARFIASGFGGIVTAFISYSDEKDEIDWEITGKEIDRGQSNFFYRGNVDYTKSRGHPTGTDTSKVYHDYEVRWEEDAITWLLDGEEVRKVLKADQCNDGVCTYPTTPSKIEVAIWDGGGGSAGTRDWAGGYVPWSETDASGFNVTYDYIMVHCKGDPVPRGPPTRKAGYSAPSLKEPMIAFAAPGVQGYDDSKMKSTGSIFTQQQKVNNGVGGGSGSKPSSAVVDIRRDVEGLLGLGVAAVLGVLVTGMV
ncbi:hypothetical protein HDU67_009831 [Dinochytrium kinnereticum]|nr:hypothetical protein HDU67_009831 [Dinochytrium kinnereticum]